MLGNTGMGNGAWCAYLGPCVRLTHEAGRLSCSEVQYEGTRCDLEAERSGSSSRLQKGTPYRVVHEPHGSCTARRRDDLCVCGRMSNGKMSGGRSVHCCQWPGAEGDGQADEDVFKGGFLIPLGVMLLCVRNGRLGLSHDRSAGDDAAQEGSREYEEWTLS